MLKLLVSVLPPVSANPAPKLPFQSEGTVAAPWAKRGRPRPHPPRTTNRQKLTIIRCLISSDSFFCSSTSRPSTPQNIIGFTEGSTQATQLCQGSTFIETHKWSTGFLVPSFFRSLKDQEQVANPLSEKGDTRLGGWAVGGCSGASPASAKGLSSSGTRYRSIRLAGPLTQSGQGSNDSKGHKSASSDAESYTDSRR